MNALTPVAPSVSTSFEQMIKRQALLNHPCEFFRQFFGGRVPTLAEKIAWVEQSMQLSQPAQIWENDTYIVRVFVEPPFVHLDISRKDEQPCKNWRDFQQIKNEIVGPNHEAVELFPSEQRLVDTANQYHLWVHTEPGYRFPFGFPQRCVLREPIRLEVEGSGRIRTSVASVVPLDSAPVAPAA